MEFEFAFSFTPSQILNTLCSIVASIVVRCINHLSIICLIIEITQVTNTS